MERDSVAGFSHYAAQAPEALDYLTPKERHRLHQLLRLKVLMAKSGDLEVGVVGAPVEGSEDSSTAGVTPRLPPRAPDSRACVARGSASASSGGFSVGLASRAAISRPRRRGRGSSP
jgi:hypothetical protein